MMKTNRDHLIELCQENGVSLVPFDDGHIPLNFKRNSPSDDHASCGLVARRNFIQRTSNPGIRTITTTHVSARNNGSKEECCDYRSRMLHVCEDALPHELADEIYQTTVPSPKATKQQQSTADGGNNHQKSNDGKPWGEYVTIKEARKRAEEIQQAVSRPPTSTATTKQSRTRKDIAIDAVAQFFLLRLPDCFNGTNELLPLVENSFVHGVAVWVLAADVQSEVEYHIDYAELVRYEYNITYPPLYGATVHCSRLWSNSSNTSSKEKQRSNYNTNSNTIVGGDFVAFMEGFAHYERHGYKGTKQPVEYSSSTSSFSLNDVHIVPYKFNRGILLHGEIPHLSSPITYIKPNSIQRVIMGFNVFDTIVGPFVAEAPEHSSAFNRRIKIYQAISSSAKCNNFCYDLQSILHNKPLAKILVQAKREKMKRQFWQDQKLLHDCIKQLHKEYSSTKEKTNSLFQHLDSPSNDAVLTAEHLFHALSHSMECKNIAAADIQYAIKKYMSEKDLMLL